MPQTLGDFITEITDAALGIVDAGTIGMLVAGGAVISLAAIFIGRFLRAGR